MENIVKFGWSRKGEDVLPNVNESESQIGAGKQLSSESTAAFLQVRSGSEDLLAEDLLRRVRHAIQEWTTANRLGHLPEEVVFEQAVSILNSMYHVYRTQERNLNRDKNESYRKRPSC